MDLKEAKAILEELLKEPEKFEDKHPADIAKILKIIYYEEGKESFLNYIKKIPIEYLGEILLELPEHIKDEALEELSVEELLEAVDELDSDDAADLIQDLSDLDEEKEQEVLSKLDSEDAQDIKRLIGYEEDQAGSIMQTELFSAKLDEKIKDAIERLKELKAKDELSNIHQVFLVDDFGFLVGSIPLEDVITFDFNKTFRDYLKERYKKVLSVRATDSIDEVIKLFEDYDLVVLPVVDRDGKLIGRITSDDIYDMIEERATEQIYKMSGVDEESEEEQDIKLITKKRAIWLGINLVTAILASFVIGLFDQTIQSYVALAVLMPIVASMGGNAGTQSLTVVVRQIALGELSWQEAKGAILREVSVSLLNGLIFAFIMGAIAYFWFHDYRLGIVIAIAMVINLFFAGLFGALIPLALKRVGIDPAVASSVLLTTVTDVVGFFAFLGLAKVIILKG
ncbi:MAG: magnesium transporter [Epsilonproteobacteria bacterium]|nr:magnesium transporter [Campylobacterota bacterium]